jgi:DNA-binding MarR family transcriptional regulator
METTTRDVIDEVVEQWATQCPHLDVRSIAVAGRISRAGHLLDRSLKHTLAEHGVQDWELDVLATLRRHSSGPLTVGELVATSLVTSASMTNRIDRLASKGQVTRRVDDANRRSVLVELTDVGQQLVDEAITVYAARAAELLSGLGETNQQRLAVLLRRLLVTLGDDLQ